MQVQNWLYYVPVPDGVVAREATTEHHTKSKTWAARDMIPSYFTDKPTRRTRRDVLQLGCLKANRHFRRIRRIDVCAAVLMADDTRVLNRQVPPPLGLPRTHLRAARSRDLGLRDLNRTTGAAKNRCLNWFIRELPKFFFSVSIALTGSPIAKAAG